MKIRLIYPYFLDYKDQEHVGPYIIMRYETMGKALKAIRL